VHHLKTQTGVFRATWRGDKLYEIRQEDRPAPFEVGDTVVLREWSHSLGYTGGAIVAEITVFSRDAWGLPKGLVVFGIRIVERLNHAELQELPAQTYEVKA
jgi:hypothetical protein